MTRPQSSYPHYEGVYWTGFKDYPVTDGHRQKLSFNGQVSYSKVDVIRTFLRNSLGAVIRLTTPGDCWGFP